jgi:hypothetical protein
VHNAIDDLRLLDFDGLSAESFAGLADFKGVGVPKTRFDELSNCGMGSGSDKRGFMVDLLDEKLELHACALRVKGGAESRGRGERSTCNAQLSTFKEMG